MKLHDVFVPYRKGIFWCTDIKYFSMFFYYWNRIAAYLSRRNVRKFASFIRTATGTASIHVSNSELMCECVLSRSSRILITVTTIIIVVVVMITIIIIVL